MVCLSTYCTVRSFLVGRPADQKIQNTKPDEKSVLYFCILFLSGPFLSSTVFDFRPENRNNTVVYAGHNEPTVTAVSIEMSGFLLIVVIISS